MEHECMVPRHSQERAYLPPRQDPIKALPPPPIHSRPCGNVGWLLRLMSIGHTCPPDRVPLRTQSEGLCGPLSLLICQESCISFIHCINQFHHLAGQISASSAPSLARRTFSIVSCRDARSCTLSFRRAECRRFFTVLNGILSNALTSL